MFTADFHDSIFLLRVIVTTYRIDRILTGSNDLYKTRLLSHFALYVQTSQTLLDKADLPNRQIRLYYLCLAVVKCTNVSRI